MARAVGDSFDAPERVRDADVPGSVPGCIHTDLIRAGLIGDPCVGFNELEIQWVGGTDWEYRAAFDADPVLFAEERRDLVFDGLDTVATVLLNRERVGEAANMFHPHRFDVRRSLREGVNELAVRFRAPLKYIREMEARLGARPVNGDWDPFNFMRKAACNFGWDWGPKVATVGIWKPVRIEAWSTARLASVRPLVIREDDTRWRVSVRSDVEHADPGHAPEIRLTATLRAPNQSNAEDSQLVAGAGGVGPLPNVSASTPDATSAHFSLDLPIDSPILWRARSGDLGQSKENRLYPLSVQLLSTVGGTPLDTLASEVGFRTIEVDTSPDAEGSAFTFRVNGQPQFCIGANWIPEGLWPGQVRKETYRQRIEQACRAGANMLRVWGGGYYEDEEFYRECDRRGILVWQDFMFSCAMYPEEAPFPALVEAEARHQIARLSTHPSVAIWCGGNECVWGHESWGWKERLKPGQSWGRGYYLELLPRLVAELDPTRPYWPNSPWSGDEATHPNDGSRGDRHTWDVRVEGYLGVPCRFLSEAGHQSPSLYSTLAAALPVSELALGSSSFEHRQRGPGGNTKQYAEVLDSMFRPARTFDEWHAQAHLAQARAVRFAVDSALARYPRCGGVLIWQLNDAWPGLSWSLIDSAGRAKPALDEISIAGRLLFHPVDGRLAVSLACFGIREHPTSVSVARVATDGRVLREQRVPVSGDQSGVTLVGFPQELVGRIEEPAEEFYMATVLGGPFKATPLLRRTWFAVPDKDLRLPRPLVDSRWQDLPGHSEFGAGLGVVLTARTFLKDVQLSCDRLPLQDEFEVCGPRTLLPGEELSVIFKRRPGAAGRMDAATLAAPPHLWCANHFAAGT